MDKFLLVFYNSEINKKKIYERIIRILIRLYLPFHVKVIFESFANWSLKLVTIRIRKMRSAKSQRWAVKNKESESIRWQMFSFIVDFSKFLGLVTYLDWIMILVTILSAISMSFETPANRVVDRPFLQVHRYLSLFLMKIKFLFVFNRSPNTRLSSVWVSN